MIELISWFSLVVYWVTMPSIVIIAILFHRQQKTKGTLILAFGLGTILISVIIDIIFPQTFNTIEEAEHIITTSGPPLQWLIDDVVRSVGAILTLLGFGLIVIENKKPKP